MPGIGVNSSYVDIRTLLIPCRCVSSVSLGEHCAALTGEKNNAAWRTVKELRESNVSDWAVWCSQEETGGNPGTQFSSPNKNTIRRWFNLRCLSGCFTGNKSTGREIKTASTRQHRKTSTNEHARFKALHSFSSLTECCETEFHKVSQKRLHMI